MPKVVDAEQRRRQVFDALFDVIAAEGVEKASLRRVAETAGLALGSLRHYFDSHEAMMRGAATEVIDRISARLESRRPDVAEARHQTGVVEDMLAELLPLDEPTSREVVVWLEFAVAARTNPALGEAADRLHVGVRSLAAIILERSGTVPQEAIAVETERLAALIDGLAMGGALHPDKLSPAMSRAVVRRHLEALGVSR